MARVAKRRPAKRAGTPNGGDNVAPRRTAAAAVNGTMNGGADPDPQTPTKPQRTTSITNGTSKLQTNGHADIYDVPLDEEAHSSIRAASPTPTTPASTRKRGRPRKPYVYGVSDEEVVGKKEDSAVDEPPVETPLSKRRRTTAFATPTKRTVDTPTRRTLADRSARRKTTRALIDRVVAGGDEDEDEDALEEAIFGVEEEDDHEQPEEPDEKADKTAEAMGEEPVEEVAQNEQKEEEQPQPPQPEETPLPQEAPTPRRRGRPPKPKLPPAPVDPNAPPPVKRGPGRPRKDQSQLASSATAASKRETTPPRDLPAHEHYFFQNRPGAAKTSNNTLGALRLLTHEEFFKLRGEEAAALGEANGTSERPGHGKQIAYLESLHAQSFAQWAFELAQGFGVCLYGYGAKRRVLRAFATELYNGIADHAAHKIVMVCGSGGGGGGAASSNNATSTLRDILNTVALAIGGVSGQSTERALLNALDDTDVAVTLIIDGIDAPALRRPATQATIARLAAHRRVRLLCAADTPGFALLWDGAARAALSLVFHDATTFRPLDGGGGGLDVVDDVHALLGRRVRRVGGKDGAAFVLRSLPENARTLFRLLVGEVLANDTEGGGAGNRRGFDDDDDEYDDDEHHNDDEAPESVGLEYRMLYNKAVEEFICSSEMAFRTLLKEFHDHQMVTSRKDAFGTELLSLPFRRDELEALLEELM